MKWIKVDEKFGTVKVLTDDEFDDELRKAINRSLLGLARLLEAMGDDWKKK